MTKHERIYIILLIVIAFCCMISIGDAFIFMRHPSPSGDPDSPKRAFELMSFIEFMFLADILLILLIRLRWPVKGHLFLTALNIILLIYVPFGTILGIYYFVKVNKRAELPAT